MRRVHAWKLGCRAPAVMQSPSAAYPAGACGRQTVTPRSPATASVSTAAPAAPAASAWLLHTRSKRAQRVSGLRRTTGLRTYDQGG